MSLLSYKKWQKLNENFGVNLGVKQPNKIADLHSRWDEMGLSMPMMKKKSKKMFGDGPDEDAAPDDSMGGGDAPSFGKKGKKKPPFGGGDDADAGPDVDADSDLGDMGDDLDDKDHDGDANDMGDNLGGKDDDGDSDIDLDGDDDADDLGGEGESDDAAGDDAGPMAGAGGPDGPAADMPMPKKKGGSFIDKTKAVADGAKMMHKGASKMIKGMKEGSVDPNEAEFWRSLQSQTGATKFAHDNGAWNPVVEDAIVPPTDPNANLSQDEPGPGEPGFAPQGRVGSNIGSFTEWAEKYKRKSK